MGNVLDSIDNLLISSIDKGVWRRFIISVSGTVTAWTSSQPGDGSICRAPVSIDIPASNFFGANIDGMYVFCTGAHDFRSTHILCCLEYDLFQYISNGNYAYPKTMPTKTLRLFGGGQSTICASVHTFLLLTTTFTALSPVFTFTYTNQNGDTNRTTAQISLPNTVEDWTVYQLDDVLQSGDTGIREVTGFNLVSGTITSGTFSVRGTIPIFSGPLSSASILLANHDSVRGMPIPLVEANDTIAFYGLLCGTNGIYAGINLIGIADYTI